MRKTHYIVTLICCISFSALAQELVELNVFESGNFKTFVYKDSSEQLRGEWYIYNTAVDSFLFAFGPIAVSGEDENYVQNGTWSYSNLGQKAKKVSYILGDEHSSDLRSNYHMGQSYFPIPLYHITNILSKSKSFRPEWSINTVSADSNALSKVSLDIADLNESIVIELPDLILNPDTKKINPETFRFQFQFNNVMPVNNSPAFYLTTSCHKRLIPARRTLLFWKHWEVEYDDIPQETRGGVQGSQHWRGFIRTRGTRDARNGVSEHNPERRRRMEIGRL